MKNNMERMIKEAFEQHQSPYQEGAWESVSQKMTFKKGTSNWVKWSLISVISAACVILVFVYTDSTNENKTIQSKSVAQTPTKSERKENQPIFKESNPSIQLKQESVKPSYPVESESSSKKEYFTYPTEYDEVVTATPIKEIELNLVEENSTSTDAPKTIGNDAIRDLNLPQTVCLNDELIISNPYKTRNITVQHSDLTSTILPGKQLKIRTNEAGNVIVKHLKEEVIAIQSSNLKLNVDLDVSLMYDKGIPSLKFIASGSQNSITWNSNVNSSETNQSALIVHPYKERTVRVTAKTLDENGCSVEETKSVSINEPYNLLAVTGFKPASSDNRNNRFMPFALTQRETPFDLVIFDPENGGVVFQSSDALNGWDGTDKRSGNMVKEATVWLWKVRMKSPNAGEPSEYSGTITRL